MKRWACLKRRPGVDCTETLEPPSPTECDHATEKSTRQRAHDSDVAETFSVTKRISTDLELDPIPPVAPWRAWTLLMIFSMAQLLDIFNVTAPTIALPDMASDLNFEFSQRQWAINAYSLTFGAFLLTGGRLSAMYGPEVLFVAGFTWVGVCAIINGFAVNGPMLFVFRALQGIGAASTIPSALMMITKLFPSRGEQDRALGIYAGFGAIGSVGGLVLGGIISQLISWKWIFWIMSMVILPLALAAFFLAPRSPAESRDHFKLANMDWIGLATITLSLILFVYSLTEGNTKGWTSGGVLAPLIISIALMAAFGFIETKVFAPLIPPAVWTLPAFLPLFIISISEYLIMNVIIFQESEVFQQVWGTSALSAAIRTIPLGTTGFFMTFIMGHITQYISPRWIITASELVQISSALLVIFAPTSDKYWDRVFPAFILEGVGISTVFVTSNIAILRTPLAKPSAELHESTALIGAIFNSVLQFGSAFGLAIATAITTRVNGPATAASSNFAGYKASYWFIIGLAAFEAVLAFVTLRDQPPVKIDSVEATQCGEDNLKEKTNVAEQPLEF